MKKYNRTTKKWEEVDEEAKAKSLKKKKLCKGGKPHNYILALPWPYSQLNVTPRAVEEYYLHEQRVIDFMKEEAQILEGYGIKKTVGFYERIVSRHFVCDRCSKREVIYEKR